MPVSIDGDFMRSCYLEADMYVKLLLLGIMPTSTGERYPSLLMAKSSARRVSLTVSLMECPGIVYSILFHLLLKKSNLFDSKPYIVDRHE